MPGMARSSTLRSTLVSRLIAPLALLVPLLACERGANVADGSIDATTDITRAGDATADAPSDIANPDADGGRPGWGPDCDPLVEQECALPWPSNLYLVPDTTRVTGYSLQFGPTSRSPPAFVTNTCRSNAVPPASTATASARRS